MSRSMYVLASAVIVVLIIFSEMLFLVGVASLCNPDVAHMKLMNRHGVISICVCLKNDIVAFVVILSAMLSDGADES